MSRQSDDSREPVVIRLLRHDREIRVEVDESVDEFGQFGLRLLVDGKVRHEANYTAREVPDG